MCVCVFRVVISSSVISDGANGGGRTNERDRIERIYIVLHCVRHLYRCQRQFCYWWWRSWIMCVCVSRFSKLCESEINVSVYMWRWLCVRCDPFLLWLFSFHHCMGHANETKWEWFVVPPRPYTVHTHMRLLNDLTLNSKCVSSA